MQIRRNDEWKWRGNEIVGERCKLSEEGERACGICGKMHVRDTSEKIVNSVDRQSRVDFLVQVFQVSPAFR